MITTDGHVTTAYKGVVRIAKSHPLSCEVNPLHKHDPLKKSFYPILLILQIVFVEFVIQEQISDLVDVLENVCECICAFVCVYLCVCKYVCISVCASVCRTCVCVYLSVCKCSCIYGL